MRTISILIRGVVCAAVVLLAAALTCAQSDRGTIAGTVLDSSGAIVANAQVTALGTGTAATYTAVTGPTGGYRIPEVKIGVYTVTVAAPGFKTEQKTEVLVQVNTVSTVDFALTIGDVKETLTVVADAPSIQSESSDIGTVVSTKQIEELPLALNATGQSFLRSAQSFVFLTPGTTGPGTSSDSPSAGIFESKISGGQNFSTEILLDGASTARADSGSAFDQNSPSVEAISEFKVTTSTITAAYGRTSGGVQSFSTKSGTSSYHGTAFDLLRNDKLDANSWTNDFNGAPKPRDHQNDFGGSLGGPVRVPKLYNGKDKTFFFFSWEQYRNNQGFSSITSLPTDAERGGDFSALLGAPTGAINPCDGTPILTGQIFDPSTTQTVGGVQCRTAFAGNKITTPLSTVAQNVLSFLTVHPNRPGDNNGLVNNFLFSGSKPIRDTTMSFRIDQNWGTNNKFFFSYSSRDQEVLNGTPTIPPPLDPNFFNSNFTHYTRFGWDRTIGSTMANHLNIGLNRLNDFSKGESVTGVDWDKVLGISGASGPVFPQFSFQGSPLGVGYQGLSTANDDGNLPNGLITADSFSWVKGRHTLNFGFDWRSYQFSRLSQAQQSPNFVFQNFQTAYTPNNSQTGDPFASFLLGQPDQESLQINSQFPRWNSNYYAGYAQDDFKFRSNLTINLGLRYEVETPRHEAHGAQSVLDLTAQNAGTPGTAGAMAYGSSATGAKTYYKDFGPHVGFAYAPSKLFGHFDNTVIRGGYSIYYAALSYSDFGNNLQSGTSATPNFQSPDKFTPVQSLDQGFPSFTPPSNNQDPTLNNGGFPDYVAPEYGRPAMVQNWSLEVQHQLAPDLILSVGYIGLHSTRLHSNLAQVNTINPQFLPLGFALNNSVDSAAGQATLATLGVSVPSWFDPLYAGSGNNTVGQLLRPHPNFQSIGTNCCLENLGQSTYNALQAKVERHFRNGLNLLASYTYSKTLTDADSSFPIFTGFNSNVFGAQNPYNLKSEKSVSYQDIPHTFVMSYLYELPLGKGKKLLNKGGAVDKIVGGWQVGGVHRYQVGSPFVIYAGATSPNFTGGNFHLSSVPGQPLLAPNHSSYNPLAGGSGCQELSDGTFVATGTNNFFNCAAFLDPNVDSLVAQRGYVFGDLGLIQGNIRSQGYKNEDFSIVKRISLYEAHVLTLKVDLPNAFNRHTFARGDGCITCGTFGQPGSSFGGGGPSSINPARQIQITMRYQF